MGCPPCALAKRVRALFKVTCGGTGFTVDHGQVLPRQDQGAWAGLVLQGGSPGGSGFGRIARANDGQSGDASQGRKMFDGLVCGAVFTDEETVVCQHVDHGQPHHGRQPDRGTEVVGEHKEGRSIHAQPAVQRHPVQDRAHPVFADPEMKIASREPAGTDRVRFIDQRLRARRQVGRASDELGHGGGNGLNGGPGRGACRHGFRRIEGWKDLLQGIRQNVVRVCLPCRRLVRMSGCVRLEAAVPSIALPLHDFQPCREKVANGIRNVKRFIRQAQVGACGPDLLVAKRFPVGGRSIVLVRAPVCDMGMSDNDRGALRVAAGATNGTIDLVMVMTIDLDHTPVIALEPLLHVVAVREVRGTLDRDAVAVVKQDELGQPKMSGEREGFVADPFHQVAIPADRVRVMVQQFHVRGVESRGKHPLRECHAHGITASLAERAGRCFHAGRVTGFRVSGGLAVPLPEGLQLGQGKIVAGKMKKAVQKHGPVTRGENETVPIRPLRAGGTMNKVFQEQYRRNVGHPHGHAGMAGTRLLHPVHRQAPDSVCREKKVVLGDSCRHGVGPFLSGRFDVPVRRMMCHNRVTKSSG